MKMEKIGLTIKVRVGVSEESKSEFGIESGDMRENKETCLYF